MCFQVWIYDLTSSGRLNSNDEILDNDENLE